MATSTTTDGPTTATATATATTTNNNENRKISVSSPRFNYSQYDSEKIQWQAGICDICAAGCAPCLLVTCVPCPCLNVAFAMNTMDPGRNICGECCKAYWCCGGCQRNDMRKIYGIEGSLWYDGFCYLFCFSNMSIQMLAEAKRRSGHPIGCCW